MPDEPNVQQDMPEKSSASDGEATAGEVWSPARRVFFRFAFCYGGLYFLPFPIYNLPLLGLLGGGWEALWTAIVPWVGDHFLPLGAPAVQLQTGSGDHAFAWALIFTKLVIAIFATALWSALDHRRLAYPILEDWLHVYLRYALAVILFTYGIVKILPLQFQPPQLDRLMQPYGQASPMALLWTLMGYSRPYAFFGGLTEAVGGLLLLFRRTTLAGALMVAAVMANVVMLNFSFDVPVKQYSSHLLLTALFLAWPDRHRLADFFLGRGPVSPRPLGRPYLPESWRTKAVYAKWAFILYSCSITTWSNYTTWQDRELAARNRPLVGIWKIAAGTDATADWRHVIFTDNGTFTVLDQDGKPLRYLVTVDEKAGQLTLKPRWGNDPPTTLSLERRDADHIHLAGPVGELIIDAELHKIPTPDFLLTSRGFHWVTDYPFNR